MHMDMESAAHIEHVVGGADKILWEQQHFWVWFECKTKHPKPSVFVHSILNRFVSNKID